MRSNAASTFIEQCGHVRLFSNHPSIHDGWKTCAPSQGNCRICSFGKKSIKQIAQLELKRLFAIEYTKIELIYSVCLIIFSLKWINGKCSKRFRDCAALIKWISVGIAELPVDRVTVTNCKYIQRKMNRKKITFSLL